VNTRRAALLGVAMMLGRRIQARSRETVKSVNDVVTGYRDDLTRDFLDVLDGRISLPEAERRHYRYIARDAEAAYIEGLAAGGVGADDLDDDDRAAIDAWEAGQRAYVGGLWEAVGDYRKARRGMERAERDAGQRAIQERIGLWAGALRDLSGLGKASALANMLVTWQLGATELHCRVCNRLDGQRHRLKWFTGRGYIPQENGSEKLDCGGWRCLCTLRDTKGKVILPA
jgi:hypothetical protein